MSDSRDDDWKVTGYGEGRSSGAILRRQLRELQEAQSKLKAEVRERERKAFVACMYWLAEAGWLPYPLDVRINVDAEAERRYPCK